MWRENLKIGAIMVGAVTSLVSLAILSPQLLLVIPGLALVYGLTKPWFRLMFFVVGAFLVFQTGDGLSITKMGYLAAVVFSAVCAIYSLRKHPDRLYMLRVRPTLFGAGLLACWILGPMLVQGVVLNGVEPQMWARDALTYLLISAGVVIGVDAAKDVPLKWARLATLAVGLLAAYGFASAWIQRRGLVESVTADASSQALLGSMVALTLPLAMCLVLGLAQDRINLPWLILAPVFLLAVLVTGTRTGFVLTVALIGVIGFRSKKRVTFGKAIFGGALGLGALSVALPAAGAAFSSKQFVQERIDMMIQTVQDGFGSDASGVIRERATNFCLDIFRENPLMGQGLGIYFPNPNPDGVAANFSLDSWAVYPAKFGLIGTVVVAASVLMIFRGLIRKDTGGWLYEGTAVRGAALATVALIPFGVPTEDKVFAVVVALAALLVCAAAEEEAQETGLKLAPKRKQLDMAYQRRFGNAALITR